MPIPGDRQTHFRLYRGAEASNMYAINGISTTLFARRRLYLVTKQRIKEQQTEHRALFPLSGLCHGRSPLLTRRRLKLETAAPAEASERICTTAQSTWQNYLFD